VTLFSVHVLLGLLGLAAIAGGIALQQPRGLELNQLLPAGDVHQRPGEVFAVGRNVDVGEISRVWKGMQNARLAIGSLHPNDAGESSRSPG